MTEEEFWAKDRQTGEGLGRMMVAAGMTDNIAIATGSEWSDNPLKRKISWRGYDGGACMPLSAQRRFWRDLVLKRGFTTDPTDKHKLHGDGVEFPTCVNLDLSVYDGGRKLRMLGSRKDSKVDGVRTLVGTPLRLVAGLLERHRPAPSRGMFSSRRRPVGGGQACHCRSPSCRRPQGTRPRSGFVRGSSQRAPLSATAPRSTCPSPRATA
jgi:hypothetical protein